MTSTGNISDARFRDVGGIKDTIITGLDAITTGHKGELLTALLEQQGYAKEEGGLNRVYISNPQAINAYLDALNFQAIRQSSDEVDNAITGFIKDNVIALGIGAGLGLAAGLFIGKKRRTSP